MYQKNINHNNPYLKWLVWIVVTGILGFAAWFLLSDTHSEDHKDSERTEIKVFQTAAKTTIHIRCAKDKALAANPSDAVSTIQSYACKTIWSDPPPWGDHLCPGSDRVSAKLQGYYRGKKVTGRYAVGPCQQSIAAWVQLSQLWSPAMQKPMQTRLFILTPDGEPPASVRRGLAEHNKQAAQSKGSFCLRSLSDAPTRSCWLQTTERTPYMAVMLTWQQIEQLFDASPERVRAVLLAAPRVPMPRGFPGYQPQQNVTSRLPI